MRVGRPFAAHQDADRVADLELLGEIDDISGDSVGTGVSSTVVALLTRYRFGVLLRGWERLDRH